MTLRFIFCVSLFTASTAMANPNDSVAVCKEGKPIEVKEIDFPDETYTEQTTTCTYRSLVVVKTHIDFSFDCKFGCTDLEYYQQKNGNKVKVKPAQIFKGTELMKILNPAFEKEHKEMLRTDPDCLPNLPYEPKTIEQISFSIDEKNGFYFGAPNDVEAACVGPLGSEYTHSLSFKQVMPYFTL